jgi:hypothetical protein
MAEHKRAPGATWQPYFSDTDEIRRAVERIADKDFAASGRGAKRGRAARNGKGNLADCMRHLIRVGLHHYQSPQEEIKAGST